MHPGPIEVSFVMVLLIIEKVSLRSCGSKSPYMFWLIKEKRFSISLYRGEYGDLGGRISTDRDAASDWVENISKTWLEFVYSLLMTQAKE